MLSTRQYKTKEEGFSDKLNWGHMIAPGVVLNKDGSLQAGWFIRGPDLAGQIPAMHRMVSERVNGAMSRLTAGWVLWVEADRIPVKGYIEAETCSFPDPVSKAIDQERREYFTGEGLHLETEYAVVLQWYPPERRKAWIADVVYSGGGDDDEPVQAETIASFERHLAEFEDAIAGDVRIRRMEDLQDGAIVRSEQVNFLQYALTMEPTSLALTEEPNYLDCFLGGVDFYPGHEVIVGEKFYACVRINGLPTHTTPGLMAGLELLPFPLRFVTRYIAMDSMEAKKQIGSIERKWRQRVRGFLSQVLRVQTAVVDEDAARMAMQASSAMSRSASLGIGTGYYTPVVVVPGATAAQARGRARDVVRVLLDRGFSAAVETINAPEAWLGSLPGNTIENVRRPPIHTDNLADLLPLSAAWQGEAQAPCPLYPPASPPLMMVDRLGAIPAYFNLHVSDMGHSLLFGPPGSGKSTLLASVALQALRYEGASVWCFDKGMSMFAATTACGGNHFDFGSSDTPKLSPLHDLETDADIAAAQDWIESCFLLQHGRPVQTDDRDHIHGALLTMSDAPGSERTITSFMSLVQSAAVRDAMRYYSLSGPFGYIFDAESGSLGNPANFVCFEIEQLMGMGEKALVPTLFHLFRRFEKSLHDQPSFLLLDEAWVMLSHPLFREKIREWLKVLRKRNCAVIVATQSLSDAERSGILDVMLEACPTKIYGANYEAATGTGSNENKGPREYYEMFGLNPAEIELVRTLQAKREYYVTSPEGRMVMDLALGPKAMAIAGAGSKKETLGRIRHLKDQHGPAWVDVWFKECAR